MEILHNTVPHGTLFWGGGGGGESEQRAENI